MSHPKTTPRIAPAQPVQPGGAQARHSDGGAEARQRFSDLLRQRRQVGDAARPPATPDIPLAGLGEEAAARPVDAVLADDALPDAVLPDAVPRVPPPDRRGSPPRNATGTPHRERGGAERSERGQAAAAAGPDAAERQVLSRLTRTIAHFCNDRTVVDSDDWRVRIPLRPDVMPESTLEMSISPASLRLRFEIGDANARNLVSRHSDELAGMLASVLARPRDISIMVD